MSDTGENNFTADVTPGPQSEDRALIGQIVENDRTRLAIAESQRDGWRGMFLVAACCCALLAGGMIWTVLTVRDQGRDLAEVAEVNRSNGVAIRRTLERIEEATSPEAQAESRALLAATLASVDCNNRRAIVDALRLLLIDVDLTSVLAGCDAVPPTVPADPTAPASAAPTVNAGDTIIVVPESPPPVVIVEPAPPPPTTIASAPPTTEAPGLLDPVCELVPLLC